MNIARNLLITVGLLFLIPILASGQDIHFSQFFNSDLNINPARTGIYNGDMRITANYRHQWYTVEVPYLTFSGAFENKIYNPEDENGFWSYGVLLNYDKAGDANLQLLQLGLSGSYTFILNENNLITPGIMIGGANRSFDFGANLRWDSQFQFGMFMENNPHMENLDQESLWYFDAGAGLNYRWQQDARTKIDVGGGLYNIFTPENSFLEPGGGELPMRITANLMTSFQLGNSFDLMINGLAQWQDEYMEVVPALIGRIYINQNRGKEFALDLGGIMRFNREEVDAWSPYIGFNRGPWSLNISYGITSSDFNIATDDLHGPELSFRYIITKVRPLKNFKTCPIF